jgi:excisionase family DNA binding protein
MLEIRREPRVKLVERLAFGIDEIARSIGVSEAFIRKEVKSGRLQSYRVGMGGKRMRILVAAESLKTYLAEREFNADAEAKQSA